MSKSANYVHAENYYKDYYDYLLYVNEITNKIFNQLKLIKLVSEHNKANNSLSDLFFSKNSYASLYVEDLLAFYVAPTKCSLFFEQLNINVDIAYNDGEDAFYLVRKNKGINIKLGGLKEATNKIVNFRSIIEQIRK